MFGRLEAREKEWRERVLGAANPFLGPDEKPQVLAIAQPWHPWLTLAVMVVGIVMANGGLIGDTYLPRWVGILGIPVAVIGVAAMAATPRLAIVRTSQRVVVFRLNRSRDAPELRLQEEVSTDHLPAWDDSVKVNETTLYPSNGIRRERELLKAAFAADPEDPDS